MATVRAVIPLFDQTLRQNIAVLAVLIGRAPVDFSVKGGSLYRLRIPRVTPGLPSELLFQRPDIRAAEANLASADASVESARAAFFPSISLTGQGGYESEVLKLLFTPQTAFYNLAAQRRAAAARRLPAGGTAGVDARPAIRVAEGLLPDRSSPASATWRSRSSRSPTPPSASVCSRSSSTPRDRPSSSPKPGCARARSISSPCCRPSRRCSRPRTIWSVARLARLQAVLSLFQALGGSWLPRGGSGDQYDRDAMKLGRRIIVFLIGAFVVAASSAFTTCRNGSRRQPRLEERPQGRRRRLDRSGSGAGDRRASAPTCRSISTASAPRGRSTP